jgi:hypothetical protein
MSIPKDLHVISAVTPAADAFGASPTTRYINTENYGHLTFVIHQAASTNSTGLVITVGAATSSTGAGAANIGDWWYAQAQSDDVYDAFTAATTTGFAVTLSTAYKTVRVEVDAALTPDGSNWVALTLTESTLATAAVGAVLCIASEARYAEEVSLTALT